MKPIRMLVAAVTSTVLMLGLASAPAYAACSGNGCDGKDAVAQGCSGDEAVTIASRYFDHGPVRVTIEVRKSPACFAVWTRFTADSDTGYLQGYRVTIREYDANKNFITQYATDFTNDSVYRGRTKMMGYSYSRWFRACWRYLSFGEPYGDLYCTDFT